MLIRFARIKPKFDHACGESIEAIRTLPQYKYLIDKGFDVLLMTENV